MADDICDGGTRGFYTYDAKPIHNININRDGGILWWFYKNGQLTAIPETNFSGTFVKVTTEKGEGYDDFNCALWLEHDDAYYVFGYFLRAKSKPTPWRSGINSLCL
jgi:hypothetical protein